MKSSSYSINKTTYKTYSYATHEDTVDHFTGTTNEKGVFAYERTVEPETSYRVKYKFYDARGRYDIGTAYFYSLLGFNTPQLCCDIEA